MLKINRYLKLFHERMNKIRKGIDIFTQRLSDKSDLKSKDSRTSKNIKIINRERASFEKSEGKVVERLNMKCNAKIKVKNTVFPTLKYREIQS